MASYAQQKSTWYVVVIVRGSHVPLVNKCMETNSLLWQSAPTTKGTAVPVGPLIDYIPRGMHIDFLLTDTEGFDANVLYGSRELFEKKKVSVYILELHMATFPPEKPSYASIRGIIKDLASMGYTCVFPLSRSTGDFTNADRLPSFVVVTGREGSFVESAKGWRNMMCYASWNATIAMLFEDVARRPTGIKSTCVNQWIEPIQWTTNRSVLFS